MTKLTFRVLLCTATCLTLHVSAQAQCPREIAVNDYNNLYLPSAFNLAEMNWTGSVNSCNPGTISQSVLTKNLQRINYYRKLVGLSTNTTFGATQTTKAQAAALLQEANQPGLTHCPGNTCDNLNCASADAIEGSQSSNLGAGDWDSGYNPIDQWIEDPGGGNNEVGHRRWILYSRAQTFGLGLTPNRSALWVFGNGGNPTTHTDFIAYPPRGYIPRDLVYPRWSFGIPGADFTNATVTVVDADNINIPLNIVARNGGFGDPVVVWEPTGIITDSNSDIKYTVTVSGISGAAQSSYTYDVWIIPVIYPPTCPLGQEWVAANCQCEPVQTCLIADLAASIRCSGASTYDADITVTYFNPPGTGSLMVNGVSAAITGSPQVVTLPGLAANGNPVNVTASFTANGGCSLTKNALFTAPAAGTCTYGCPVALSGDTPKALPDFLTVNSRIEMGLTGTISDVNIVNLKGYIDFPEFGTKMSLTSPAGTTVQLLANCSATTFTASHFNLVFDDEAGTPVPCNFTSGMSFQPFGNLSDFDGENPQGMWTFTVEIPYSSGGTRSLDSWGLEICTGMSNNCQINAIAVGMQSACDNNLYSQVVTITYNDPPPSGNLIVHGQSFPVTGSPQQVTLTGLTADGQPVNVTTYFAAQPACTFTQNNLFTAPDACMGDCAEVTLVCGQPYNGDTNNGTNNYPGYSCIGWDESGKEIVHKITTTAAGDITAALTNISGGDLDVFILSSCNSNACLAADDVTATASSQPPGTYYIVVDGYEGASGTYTLTVTANCSVDNCNTPPPASGTIASGTYQVTTDMSTAGIIMSPSNVIFKAGNSIQLNSNFEVQAGATFEAVIENCSAVDGPNSVINLTNDPGKNISKAITYFGIGWSQEGKPSSVRYKVGQQTDLSIALYDLNGNLILQILETEAHPPGFYLKPIARSGLTAGAYILQLRTAGALLTKRALLVR